VLVTGVHDGSPGVTDDDILRFRIAIFVDGVHRISDLDAMTQIPGVRRTFKVFIASQESSPP
jgi:hypothetical protein